MDDTSLSNLADAAGIEARYWDIDGRLHETSPETARRLLAALGLPAGTHAEIAASLNGLIEDRWREALPPVVIGTEGLEVGVAIRLPAELADQTVRWSVDLETGGTVNGELLLASVPVEGIHDVGPTTLQLRRLTLPAMPAGYHRLRLSAADETVASLVVAPKRCYLPPGFFSQRYRGIAAQLYTIRSNANWGIGDFSDLSILVDWLATQGEDTVGLGPLHALFLGAPQYASPYAPSSRLHLNPLHLDATAIPDFIESAETRAFVESSPVSDSISAARAASLVDYAGVASAKLPVLETLHRHFLANHAAAADERGLAFRSHVQEAGTDLRRFAIFQTLAEHFGTHEWQHWPAAFRHAAADDVEEFARAHQERVSYYQYLQWQCELQLGDAARRAAVGGMRLGLYRDLAVGVHVDGADHWANQQLFAGDARIGAPPDPFNESGQEWGVVPFNPRLLRASGYAHFISMLRANMRHAGALRIDHIMGWQRLFIIPAGSMPTEGTYIRFPFDDLLAIAALESQRNHCVMVGEDLGTVPEGFRERTAEADILSCRVLYFEREGDRFRRPAELPELATVAATTHDLATLRGYWSGADIAAKARAGIFGLPGEEQQAWTERATDIELLLRALADEGLLPDPELPDKREWTPELTVAVHAYLARSRARLLMVQLSDLENELRQANLPGTTVEFPNWRRRLERSLEELVTDQGIARALAAIAHERGDDR